jgi:uncharacterized protein with GYD domain
MPKFLIEASYTGAGVQGLISEGGSARREAVEKAAASLGGNVEAFYYAFGDSDVIVLFDMPNNVTAAALSLLVNASGAVVSKTTVLLTAQELDEAVKVHPDYRPPGG